MGLTLARRRVNRHERAPGPTPETAAKMAQQRDSDGVVDPLERLLRNAWAGLSPDIDTMNRSMAQDAAEEIAAVYLAVVRDQLANNMKLSRQDAGRYEMPDPLARAHARKYLPWQKKNGAALVSAVIRLVVLREDVARQARPLVAAALLGYARMR